MPAHLGRYGTACFKTPARPEPKKAATDVDPYVPPSMGDTKHPVPACANFRSPTPRFSADGVKSPTSSIPLWSPPGLGESSAPLSPQQGASKRSSSASAAFKMTSPRFQDPTRPTPTASVLDSPSPLGGLAEEIQKVRRGSASFRGPERFPSSALSEWSCRSRSLNAKSSRTASSDGGSKRPLPTAEAYTPRGVADSKRGPRFVATSPRFTERKPLTANIEPYSPPGVGTPATRGRVSGGASFAKGSDRFRSASAGNGGTARTSADVYVPPSDFDRAAQPAKGKSQMNASFLGSERFSSSVERQRNKKGPATTEETYTPRSVVDSATKPGGIVTAGFRSKSPRFPERARPEHEPTPLGVGEDPRELSVQRTRCAASAHFKSHSPRIPAMKHDEGPANDYTPRSFVDEILAR